MKGLEKYLLYEANLRIENDRLREGMRLAEISIKMAVDNYKKEVYYPSYYLGILKKWLKEYGKEE